MTIRRVTIFAATGWHNLGDEAILYAEVSYLRTRYPGARISFATSDSNSSILPLEWGTRWYWYFPCEIRSRPLANVGFFFRTVWEIFRSDLVVIGGGGIFYDNEAGQSFRRQVFGWSLRSRLARFFRKKTLFFGVGVDVRPDNLPVLRRIFDFPSAIVTVRDAKSAESLSAIGIPATVLPDPAFLFPPVKRNPIFVESRRSVGLSIRKGYLPDGLESVRQIVLAVRDSGFEPVFLNQSFHPRSPETNDHVFLEPLARELSIRSSASLSETLSWYSGLSAVVAMRLHAGVLSFVNGIPFYLLSYSKKTDEFAKRVRTKWVAPASEFDPDAFRGHFREFVDHFFPKEGPPFEGYAEYSKIRQETFDAYDCSLDSFDPRADNARR